MTSLTTWLSPNVMYALGWALVHFLWQGTALAAMAAGLMALSSRASARYAVAVSALVLMLAAPLLTFSFYWQARSGVADTNGTTLAVEGVRKQSAPAIATVAPAAPSRPYNAPPPALIPWLVEAWLAGVAFFSLRSAGGFWLLERQRRKQSNPVSATVLAACRALQARLGLDRAIRYCECKWLEAPAVVGWFRPVVFLPVSALTGLTEPQLEAVIAHELAHIQRLDAFVNVFQIGVETLLFYHPAVWWLNQRIRTEREHCCDDMAVSLCADAVEYARALTLMETWRSAPALAMAANRGPLSERVMRLLGLRHAGSGRRGIGLTGSILCLAAALIAGNAFLDFAYPRSSVHAAQISSVGSGLVKAALAQARTAPKASPAPGAKPSPAQTPKAEPQPVSAGSYIDAMKAAGLADLSVDTLVALKVQDVTPEYVHEMSAQGMRPDANRLIAMKVQGVTPQYIQELRAAGLNPGEDQIIAMKVQDIDAEYIRGLKDAGVQPDVDKIIAMKVQDVTPEYIRDLRSAGLNPDANLIIAMKVQDVTPAYVRDLHQLGLQASADQTVAMKVQDVTPEYVRAMQALGLKPSVNQIIAMKVQDVDPEYVKALRNSGLKDFGDDPEDYIRAKVQDITPEFVARALKHGFKDLNLRKLIELKNLGILESPADI